MRSAHSKVMIMQQCLFSGDYTQMKTNKKKKKTQPFLPIDPPKINTLKSYKRKSKDRVCVDGNKESGAGAEYRSNVKASARYHSHFFEETEEFKNQQNERRQ